MTYNTLATTTLMVLQLHLSVLPPVSGGGGVFSTTPTLRLCRISDSLGILPEQQSQPFSTPKVITPVLPGDG